MIARKAASTPATVKRQNTILAYLANGWRLKEIAQELGVSTQTLHHDMVAVRRRFDAATNEQAVAVAVRSGVIQ